MKRFTQILIILTIVFSMFLPSGLDFGGVREVQAADPVDFAIITDFGYANNTTVANVANMVNGWTPDFIVTAGDNSQGSTCNTSCYEGVVGAYYGPQAESASRTDFMTPDNFYPVPGNHDYYAGGTGELGNYLTYFKSLIALPPSGTSTGATDRYYDFVRGPVHFFMMDSGQTDGAAPPNWATQTAWLQAGLEDSTAPWQIVVMHRPPYTSGTYHSSDTNLQLDYATWGADFVIAGHNHIYERIYKDEGNLRYITAGTAGSDTRSGNSTFAGLEDYYFGSLSGAMKVVASDTRITLEYITTDGTAQDTYEQTQDAPPVAYDWVAYNDCAWVSGQTTSKITTYTDPGDGTSTGLLVDYVTGSNTNVTATITESGAPYTETDTYGGEETAVGTDAHDTFHGIVDMPGVVHYGSEGWWMDVTLTDLDPEKTYTFATSANRAGGAEGQTVTYPNRITSFTLSGDEGATNASTSGVTIINDHSVAFSTGENTSQGYVARWTGIQPGSDGSFTIRAEGYGVRYAYGHSVFMLAQEGEPLPTYTLSTSTVGDGSVTLNPLGGTYTEGTTVTLTAVPATGFAFDSWSGDLTGSDNPATILMNGNKTVTANFVVSQCFDLVFQEGSGGYASTVDTYIMESTPSDSYGNEEHVEWDSRDPYNSNPYLANYGLLRFDNMFGTNPGQIPMGSTIESAIFTYVVNNGGDTATVNDVAVSWDESVTYSGFGATAGVQEDDYYSTAVGTASGSTGTRTLNVQSSLQRWSDGATNYGWIFRPNDDDGVEFRSSEYTTQPDRPKLEVTYCLASTDPTIIVTPDALSFYALPGEVSDVKTYAVSGYNLTENITITPPTADFEISLNGTTFTNDQITLTATGGIVSEQTIYVRMKALSENTYSGDITHTSGALEETVSLTGVVSESYLGMLINGGIEKTGSQQVILDMSYGGPTPTTMRFANVAPGVDCSTVTSWSTPEAYSPTASWTLSGTADGTYKVCAQASLDGTDYTLSAEDTIDLDVGYITANPDLTASCGLDIVLVVDLSSSIGSSELLQYKDALTSFVTALQNTPTNLSIVTFHRTAEVVQDWVRLTPTTASSINTIISNLDNEGNSGTNWDDALRKARLQFAEDVNPTDSPDLIIFATDGDPSTWGGHDGDNPPNPNGEYDTNLTYAIPEAEEAKADGIHILGLGVAFGAGSLDRLKAVSGPDEYTGANLTSADVITSDFSGLAAALENLVIDLCGGTVTVYKVVTDWPSDPLNPWFWTETGPLVDDWTFTVTDISSGDSVESPSKMTSESGFVNYPVTLSGDPLEATLSIQETGDLAGYPFVTAQCKLDGVVVEDIAIDSPNVTVSGIPVEYQKSTTCTFINQDPNPTGVDLLSFEGEVTGDDVLLTWETANEINNQGFNLYRSETPDGAKLQINPERIQTKTYPGSSTGAFYEYVDVGAVLGLLEWVPEHTYYYWLEDVDLSGGSKLHGPVEITVQRNEEPGEFTIFMPMITN